MNGATEEGSGGAPSSVRRAASRLLPPQPVDRSLRGRVRRLSRPAGFRSAVTFLAYFVSVVVLAEVVRVFDIDFLNRYASATPASGLETMWQVQAGILALGFPLLLLFAELTRTSATLARSSAEVLVQESATLPGIVFSAGSILVSGVGALWLRSQEAAVVLWCFASAPAVVWLVVCYWRVLQLMLNPVLLSRRAAELLDERLVDSIREAWLVGVSNTLLDETLEGLLVAPFQLAVDPGAGTWVDIPATRSGRIHDINVRMLREVLVSLVVAPTTSDAGPGAATPAPTAVAAVLRRCGDHVDSGDALLRVRGEVPPQEFDRLATRVTRAYQIEDDLDG
jgi:hypothetical protein